MILGPSNNTIGGTSAGAGNLISGNAGFGIFLSGNQNLVAGNLIGTTATGLAALGNGAGDPDLGQQQHHRRHYGRGQEHYFRATRAVASTSNGQYNLVEGNYIGTDITGTTGLGGQRHRYAGDYNTIGGTTAAARNIISGNVGGGIINDGSPV